MRTFILIDERGQALRVSTRQTHTGERVHTSADGIDNATVFNHRTFKTACAISGGEKLEHYTQLNAYEERRVFIVTPKFKGEK